MSKRSRHLMEILTHLSTWSCEPHRKWIIAEMSQAATEMKCLILISECIQKHFSIAGPAAPHCGRCFPASCCLFAPLNSLKIASFSVACLLLAAAMLLQALISIRSVSWWFLTHYCFGWTNKWLNFSHILGAHNLDCLLLSKNPLKLQTH